MRRKFLRKYGHKKQQRREDKVNYKGLFAIVLGFIALNSCIYFYISTEKTEPVYGKVLLLNDQTSHFGVSRRIVVELENGKRVQPVLPESQPFIKRATVKLIRIETKLFGAERYRFAGYQK